MKLFYEAIDDKVRVVLEVLPHERRGHNLEGISESKARAVLYKHLIKQQRPDGIRRNGPLMNYAYRDRLKREGRQYHFYEGDALEMGRVGSALREISDLIAFCGEIPKELDLFETYNQPMKKVEQK